MTQLTVLRRRRDARLDRRPRRLPATNHTQDFRMDRVGLDELPQLGEDLVVEALDGAVMAREVEAVTDDGDVDGVGVVFVEDARDETVGEHFFDLIRGWIGGRRRTQDGQVVFFGSVHCCWWALKM